MGDQSSIRSSTSTTSSTPAKSNDDWQSSPLYIALNERLSRTESTLSALTTQVAQLSSLVKAALPQTQNGSSRLSIPPSTSGPVSGGGSSFAPFDDDSPFLPPTGTSSSPPSVNVGGDSSISALTQQIAALSSSVAQLQRIQQQTPRQNSSLGTVERNGHTPGHGNGNGNGNGLGPLPRHHGIEGILASSGPMTTPNLSLLSIGTPTPTGPPGPGPTTGGLTNFSQGRPNINRSFSSGQPLSAGGGDGFSHPRLSQIHTHNHAPSALRDWPSPGPTTAPGAPGVITPGGSVGPGNGIVITKWDHLNLKGDLLRSINKYGIGPPNKIQTRVLPFMIKGSDIIAQAPPTTERIISYVIPALHLCQTVPPSSGAYNGPTAIIVTTTVDQAMQCHKLIRGVGGPIGIRAGIATGVAGSSSLPNEVAALQRDAVHILIGTPAKIHDVMTTRGGLGGSEVRLLILDEVDQLIARNLYENVLNVAKLLPPPRRGNNGNLTPGGPITPFSPGVTSPYDAGQHSPFNPASKTPFPNTGSRFGAPGQSAVPAAPPTGIERQTCIFSNTIPTDVINFSQSLQVRDPVRVLVRREGGPNSQESVSSVTQGVNIKHTYVYLTITGSAQANSAPVSNDTSHGPGTIGSGRPAVTQGGGQGQNEAKEYKLETLVKMLDDYPLWQAIIYVGTFSMLEAVVFKLSGRKWETLYLTPDMPPQQKKAVLQQWRLSLSGNGPRFLVVFDVTIKPPEVPWAPLVINFDLPRSVEGYAARAAAAVPPNVNNNNNNNNSNNRNTQQQQQQQVNGVIVNFVQAAGGDVEMLRSTECAYRFKSAEIPSVFHDLFQH